VLQNDQLASTANISLPAGVPIHLTIINYDNGAAATPAVYANVSGTVGNVIFIANNTNVNSTQPAGAGSAINVSVSQPVSSVNDSSIAHTFTVQLGTATVLNVPIEPSSVESATFTLAAGTYNWHCMASCGSGSAGWGGAMDTPGWMAGVVYVS
jgi:plastocyanin